MFGVSGPIREGLLYFLGYVWCEWTYKRGTHVLTSTLSLLGGVQFFKFESF